MSEYHHGGEIYDKQVELDFSVNVNPLGLADGVKQALIDHLDDLTGYPDQECRALAAALAGKWKIPETQLLFGAGASDIIRMAVQAIAPEAAMVCAPTFSGYAKALQMTGTKVIYHYLKKETDFTLDEDFLVSLQEHPETEMVFLCQPNNPVGNLIPQELLLQIVTYCRDRHIYLLVDECFLPFVQDGEHRSLLPLIEDNGYLIVMNAFTKLYAMPGLRLGVAACSNGILLSQMKQLQTEWGVSVPAQIAGVAALKEELYVSRALEIVAQERDYLRQELNHLWLKVYPGEANFLLVESAQDLYTPLLERGILIRHCDNYINLSKDYYRVAVRTHEENVRLIEAIRGCTTVS